MFRILQQKQTNFGVGIGIGIEKSRSSKADTDSDPDPDKNELKQRYFFMHLGAPRRVRDCFQPLRYAGMQSDGRHMDTMCGSVVFYGSAKSLKTKYVRP
jgi:hypothetical protein